MDVGVEYWTIFVHGAEKCLLVGTVYADQKIKFLIQAAIYISFNVVQFDGDISDKDQSYSIVVSCTPIYFDA